MSLQKLLKPMEVAELLGVNTQTLSVWRCTKRYDLPFVKCGRLVGYKQADVEKFIEERTRGIK
jgi:predicted DNA-binding transcriptional regulator AlpA